MTKTLKIIAIIVGVVVVIIGFIGYSGSKNMQKHEKAQAVTDNIMENLDEINVYSKFNEKYFPKNQLEQILGGIRQNCDWKNRDGKFVDFCIQKNIGGTDQTAFIYEYYLKCDSLRFILTMNMEDEPELTGFNIEPLENENPLILYPEKQLKNR